MTPYSSSIFMASARTSSSSAWSKHYPQLVIWVQRLQRDVSDGGNGLQHNVAAAHHWG